LQVLKKKLSKRNKIFLDSYFIAVPYQGIGGTSQPIKINGAPLFKKISHARIWASLIGGERDFHGNGQARCRLRRWRKRDNVTNL